MVSFQESISPTQNNTENSGNNKRKCEGGGEYYNFLSKISKVETTKSLFDIDFHLDKPLPLDWKQCLDIQSGKIHFYNTQTQRESCKDPRQSQEKLNLAPISLDLELNLSNDSPRQTHLEDNCSKPDNHQLSAKSPKKNSDGALTRCTSWMSFEEDHQEMVAAVCMRCNMLVMLCKSSPACPNCKFMHPLDQSPITPFKPRFSLLPCKD